MSRREDKAMKTMNKYVKLLLAVIIFLLCWNLLDLVLDIFSKAEFSFSIIRNLIIPISAAFVIWLIDLFWKKKKS